MAGTKRAVKQAIKDATFGWLGTAKDLALVALVAAVGLHQAAYTSRKSAFRVIGDAGMLFEKLRSQRLQKSLRHGLYQLADAGYRDGWQVTDEGYRRIKELVPKYIPSEKREWNGSIYFAMFDIPENLRRSREKFRNILEQIGFRMIQESVWMGFDDPTFLLEDDLKRLELEDYVLMTKAEPPLEQSSLMLFVRKAYRLDQINLRYKAFLEHIHGPMKNRLTARDKDYRPSELALMYLSILKSDPQLPSVLLPDDWVGDQAFLAYKDVVIKKLPHRDNDFVNSLLMM